MTTIAIEVLVILFLTILNGVFSMSEIAIISSRKSRLLQRSEEGNRNARRALDLASNPERFLSTVQVGITLIGVLAGAYGGATIAQVLSHSFLGISALAPYAETLAMGIVVVGITYLSLIVGELVPKRIALGQPERIAALMALPMQVLSRVGAPLVWFLNASTAGILRLLRVRRMAELPVTEEEIRILLRQAADAGAIEREEREIADRVFRLGARRASTMMTPRKELVVLFTSDTPVQLRQKISESAHALYPLCEDSLDNVLGVVRTQDLLDQCLTGRLPDPRSVTRQALFVPESVPSLTLLNKFKMTNSDVALLVDEYGSLQGLITATDVLRALVGDVSYRDVPKALQRSDGSWLVDGMLPLDELKTILKIDLHSIAEGHEVETVGGFMMAVLGRVPAERDTFRWGRHCFEVLDMDGLRVDKISITIDPRSEEKG